MMLGLLQLATALLGQDTTLVGVVRSALADAVSRYEVSRGATTIVVDVESFRQVLGPMGLPAGAWRATDLAGAPEVRSRVDDPTWVCADRQPGTDCQAPAPGVVRIYLVTTKRDGELLQLGFNVEWGFNRPRPDRRVSEARSLQLTIRGSGENWEKVELREVPPYGTPMDRLPEGYRPPWQRDG